MNLEKKKHEVTMKGKKSGGMTNYLKYLSGRKIGLKGAVLAKCFDCCGFYADGRMDCKIQDCPLYPWQPYRESK